MLEQRGISIIAIGLCLDDSLWLWFSLRFYMGISGGMHWVGSEAWINEMAPEQLRGRIVGAYATIWGMGIAYALITVSLFAVGSFAIQPFIGWTADKVSFKSIAIFVASVSSLVVPFLPFFLHFPILTGSLLFVWCGSVGGYYTLGMLNVGQCCKGSDLTAASSMFVMAYTAGMVVGPLFCSASMQIAGPSGLWILPAIAPAFFILLVLRREGAATPGGNRI